MGSFLPACSASPLVVDRHIHGAATANPHYTIAPRVDIEIRGNVAIPSASAAPLEPRRPKPVTATVDSLVLEACDESEVLDSIVELVAVDVVDLVPCGNWTVVFFPDQHMLKAMSPVLGGNAAVSESRDAGARFSTGTHRMFSSRGFIGMGDVPVRSRTAALPVNR